MEYKGTLILTSTGFNVPGITSISRLFLGLIGAHYIVPKATILAGNPLFYSTSFA